MTDAFILGGVRTPVGRYGGSLSHLRTDDLVGTDDGRGLREGGRPLDHIEDITAGCVNTAHEGMGDVARWGALAAGFPDSVPAVTINRFCASSLTGAICDRPGHPMRRAWGRGRRGGRVDVSLGLGPDEGGCALQSTRARAPARHHVGGAGGPPNPVLLARNAYVEMIKTAQNVADRYELTREEIDAFALRSQQHAAAARDRAVWRRRSSPIEIPARERSPAGCSSTTRSSGVTRPPSSWPSFPPAQHHTDDRGELLALSDGASAVVLASGVAAESLGIEPLARVVASATYALDPQFMGIAPAFAIANALRRANWPRDIDVWEVHEAFAAQALGVLRELPVQLDGFEVPDERLNPNGGAVAIGHPFGSSGTRYVLTLATELHLREVRYGVLGVCVGSGQGVALVLENPGTK